MFAPVSDSSSPAALSGLKQVHEPILALGKTAAQLRADAEAAMAALSSAGLPLHLVIPYDDLDEQVSASAGCVSYMVV